jgi:hypothetical protein
MSRNLLTSQHSETFENKANIISEIARMPKRKKSKRPRIKDVSEFGCISNLTGFGNNEGSSLDDCMAEMMFQGQSQKQSPLNESIHIANTTSLDSTQTQNKDDQTLGQIGIEKTLHPSWIQQANKLQTSSKTMMSKEDIDNWNQNFRTWAKKGIYTSGLLPNIDQEIARNFKVKELSTLLLKNEHVAGKDLRMPLFERWLLDSKHEEDVQGLGGDSVLPLKSSPDSEASQRLLSELISKQNGVDQEDAEKIIAKLCRTTNLVCQELLSQEDRYRRQSPLKNGDRLNMSMKSTSTENVVTIEYSRKKWKKPFVFKLNHHHYKKLKDRFMQIHPNLTFGERVKNSMGAKIERSFHVLVLALLLRYSALSGGGLLDDLRGGGMQGKNYYLLCFVLCISARAKNSFLSPNFLIAKVPYILASLKCCNRIFLMQEVVHLLVQHIQTSSGLRVLLLL